jgi:uncharacterized protein YbcI
MHQGTLYGVVQARVSMWASNRDSVFLSKVFLENVMISSLEGILTPRPIAKVASSEARADLTLLF